MFKEIAVTILGQKYDLSLVICTDKISRHNTLAYPLSKSEGEILLNPAHKGQYSVANLFIHSCAHLAGYRHGKAMDKYENKIAKDVTMG